MRIIVEMTTRLVYYLSTGGQYFVIDLTHLSLQPRPNINMDFISKPSQIKLLFVLRAASRQ